MADISKVSIPNVQNPYDIKDAKSQAALVPVINKGAKNLLEITRVSQTINGVTFTVNDDDTVTIDTAGVASQNRVQFLLRSVTAYPGMQGCVLSGAVQNNQDVQLRFQLGANPWTVYASDSGSGATISSYSDASLIQVYINVPAGSTVSNLVFKPMICTKAEWDISHEYVPYGKTNAELTVENASQQSEINYAVNTGVKNLLKITGTTASSNGIKYTVNQDGTIAVTGTATANSFFMVGSLSGYTGDIIMTGCPANGGYQKWRLFKEGSDPSQSDTGNGMTYTLDGTSGIYMIEIYGGQGFTDANPLIFRPMLRPASITDPTFQPYAKTNRELTVENASQQSEIDYAVNTGAKNLLNPADYIANSRSGVTITYNGDGTYSLSGTPTQASDYLYTPDNIYTDLYGLQTEQTYMISTGVESSKVLVRIIPSYDGVRYEWNRPIVNNASEKATFTIPSNVVGLLIDFRSTVNAGSLNGIVLKPMIRPASITDDTFVPYALPNPTLTPAAIKAVDEGAKNLCNWSASTSTIEHVTFTINSDKTVSTSGTATARAQKGLTFTVSSTLKAGRYALSGCPSGGIQSGTILYCLYIWDNTANTRVCSNDTGDGIEFDWTPDASHTYTITIDVRSGTNASGLTFKPMICTAADWAVSQKFVPYAMSNVELTVEVKNITPTIIKDQSTSVGTSYTLISSLTQTTTSGKLCRISAIIAYRNYRPRGIVLSYSNDSSNFDTGDKLIAKTETAGDSYELSASAIISRNNIPVYVWAKAATVGAERIYSIMEQLGDL